jgi:dienelactone hydrolase
VLSPQHAGEGCPEAAEVHAFIGFALRQYAVDERRVYLTGLSCGAIGAWRYLGRYRGSQVAAVVPICGDGRSASLLACPSPPRKEVKMTVYPGVGHNSHSRTYDGSAGHDVYGWLLGFRR